MIERIWGGKNYGRQVAEGRTKKKKDEELKVKETQKQTKLML